MAQHPSTNVFTALAQIGAQGGAARNVFLGDLLEDRAAFETRMQAALDALQGREQNISQQQAQRGRRFSQKTGQGRLGGGGIGALLGSLLGPIGTLVGGGIGSFVGQKLAVGSSPQARRRVDISLGGALSGLDLGRFERGRRGAAISGLQRDVRGREFGLSQFEDLFAQHRQEAPTANALNDVFSIVQLLGLLDDFKTGPQQQQKFGPAF